MFTADERWVALKEFSGYSISDHGRLRRDVGAKGHREGLIIGGSKDSRGYIQFEFDRRGERKIFMAHRLVAKYFVGECPCGLNQINHKDGVKTNNLHSNLEWTNGIGNMRHARENGLITPKKGESHWKARLAEGDIRAIRTRSGSECKTHLASEFGVTYQHIWQICKRKSWRHV